MHGLFQLHFLHTLLSRGEMMSALDELRAITTYDDNLERQYKEGKPPHTIHLVMLSWTPDLSLHLSPHCSCYGKHSAIGSTGEGPQRS